MSRVTRAFEGVIPNLERLYQESESEFTRNRLKAFMSPQFCDVCNGQRLKPEILAVRIGDSNEPLNPPGANHGVSTNGEGVANSRASVGSAKDRSPLPGLSIMDVCALSVEQADDFFAKLKLSDFQEKIAHEIIK